MLSHPQLSEDEQAHLQAVFHEEVAPRLARLDARIGTISCAFAGEPFRNWNVVFRALASGFEILEFEYDEAGADLDLDL